MTHLETLQLEHLPEGYNLHVALYTSVTNASFLHQQLLAGNTDFEYGLIDPTVIVSKLHVLAAAYRAINDLLEGRLRTRNVHSEMVFCLSPSNNIAESFRRFGITPTSTSVLVFKLSTPTSPFSAESVAEHLASSIAGTLTEFSDESIAKVTDRARVRKVYKLGAEVSGKGSKGKKEASGDANGDFARTEELERREFEVQTLGAMALRGLS